MTAQHAGDKAGGAVFTADIGIGRRRGAGEPEDKGEILLLLPNSGAGRLHVFEIGYQRLTTIFDVENAGKIANFLIQPVISHSFCRLPYISPVAFWWRTSPVRRSCLRRR